MDSNESNGFKQPAYVLVALMLTAIVFVSVSTDWHDWSELGLRVLPGDNIENLSATEQGVRDVFSDTTPIIAKLLLTDFVLPFEAASILLLAAIIGALVLVREQER